MKFLEAIFDLLLSNKSLPYYSAERRIDIFINIFLAEILNHKLKKKGIIYLLPELPLKKEKDHKSTKVDYLCFDKYKKIIYFVELKTDVKYFSTRQLVIYKKYETWGKCQSEIKAIAGKSKEKQKFEELNKRLQAEKLLDHTSKEYTIEIIYLAPESESIRKKIKSVDDKNNITYISFGELADFKSTSYQREWEFFYKNFLTQI